MTPHYLSAAQVAAMCSCGERCVTAGQVRGWSRVGVKVRKTGRVVKLSCVELPGGRAWRSDQVEGFLLELGEARAEARREKSDVGCGTSDVGTGQKSLRLVGARGVGGGFARCAASEIGTYPAEAGMGHTARGMDAMTRHIAGARGSTRAGALR